MLPHLRPCFRNAKDGQTVFISWPGVPFIFLQRAYLGTTLLRN